MSTYRKKPERVEAVQVTKELLRGDGFPQWLKKAWCTTETDIMGKIYLNPIGPYEEKEILLNSPLGKRVAYIGDYIVLSEEGFLFVCRERLFNSIYEEVKEND